ncbi:MAG: thioredoxin domain-containing protein [Polyangiaceae bacterium]|nr:thioredoxin domain-containing protein [Polyangiaceae bacterium]
MSLPRRALALAAVALAAGAALGCGPKLPEALRPEADKTPKGQLLIVEFVDFECPYCRENHLALRAALEPYRQRVRLVRKQVPLDKHPMARPAARAAVCADKLERGDAMADALAQAPLEDIGPEGILKLGASVGLDPSLLEACVNNPATEAHIAADLALFEAVGGTGVPRLWIGAEELRGRQDQATFARVVADALH